MKLKLAFVSFQSVLFVLTQPPIPTHSLEHPSSLHVVVVVVVVVVAVVQVVVVDEVVVVLVVVVVVVGVVQHAQELLPEDLQESSKQQAPWGNPPASSLL